MYLGCEAQDHGLDPDYPGHPFPVPLHITAMSLSGQNPFQSPTALSLPQKSSRTD